MEQTIQTVISAENHWALLAVLFAATALAIWLEQKYKWASRISGAIITLILAVTLVNLHVIPDSAPVFDDVVWGYAVPLAIPLRYGGRNYPGNLAAGRQGDRASGRCSNDDRFLYRRRCQFYGDC